VAGIESAETLISVTFQTHDEEQFIGKQQPIGHTGSIKNKKD